MMEAPMSAAYLMARAVPPTLAPPVPEKIWQLMMRQPSFFPEPPATPATPFPLLFTAAIVPPQWVPWPESPCH